MEGPAIEVKVARLETPTKRANIFVVFIASIKSLKCAANKPFKIADFFGKIPAVIMALMRYAIWRDEIFAFFGNLNFLRENRS